MPTNEQNCRCPSCLAQTFSDYVDQSLDLNGREIMVEMASQHRNAGTLAEYVDYTIEDGNYVFSIWHHLKRGTCCRNGCRQCPY